MGIKAVNYFPPMRPHSPYLLFYNTSLMPLGGGMPVDLTWGDTTYTFGDIGDLLFSYFN